MWRVRLVLWLGSGLAQLRGLAWSGIASGAVVWFDNDVARACSFGTDLACVRHTLGLRPCSHCSGSVSCGCLDAPVLASSAAQQVTECVPNDRN